MGSHRSVTTVVSTKGQVILPKAIRDLRQWPAGTRLVVEDTPDGVLLRAASQPFAATDIDAVFGKLRPRGRALSLDEMDAAVKREAARRARD